MTVRRVLGASVVAIILAVVVLALWGDSTLDRAAADALRVPPRLERDRNAFNPMTGFTTAADRDAAEAGHAAVTRVNALLGEPGGPDHAAAIRAAWIEPVLTLEDREGILCSAKEPGCTARLVASGKALDALALTHAALLERYDSLAGYPEYRLEIIPHVDMPLPGFHALLATHRLWLGLRASAFARGDPGALVSLGDDRRLLRRLLAQADNLLTKMVVASMLVENLHVHGALLDLPGSSAADFSEIEALSAAELSLDAALAGEFRFSASAIYALDSGPEIRQDLGLPPWIGAAALRPLFKPGRSLNTAHRCWLATLEAVRGEPGDLIERAASGDAPRCETGWTEWLLNPIGTVLLTVAAPGFDQYAARLHDVDGLITLVNLKRAMRAAGVDDPVSYLAGDGARFVDPYRGRAMQWDAATGDLSFESAAPHAAYNRLPLDAMNAAAE